MAIPGNFLSPTTEMVDPNTSGWRAKLNCTISLASGGQNGDGCLAVTSSAAGEMQARTAASYPVTPGEVYWTFADASGATVPERIGIRWLDTAGTELDVTWSQTTAAASASWHRISVAGEAPAGAAAAQVLLSSTPAGAGVTSYYENVYLGWPLRTAGNLLSFNAESGGELDLSAWAAETNCTLSRTVPVSSWPATWYYAGGHMVTLTATNNGDAATECVERAPVTPGVDYQAYAYLSPPTTGSDTWVELRYYDADGVQVAAHRGYLDAASTGFQRQRASGIAPADAATASIAVGIDDATAGQVMHSEGAVVRATEIVVTGSVMPYADASFESGVGDWAVASGVAAIARSSPWGAHAIEGSYSLTVSSATATASTLQPSSTYPVVGEVNWRLEAYFIRTAGGWSIALAVDWYDDTDALISSDVSSAEALPADGQWWQFSADFPAPAGAVAARVGLLLTATGSSSTVQVDRVALWQVRPLTEVAADDETASVRLILRELDPGDLITVWRILADGTRTLVRGRDGLLQQVEITGDSMVIEDYEAPLGVPVYYRIEMTNADGLTGFGYRTTDTVTIDPGDPNWVWLKDPARPPLNRRFLVKSAPDWKQGIEQGVHRVRGRPNPVVISDVRQGREGELVGWTTSDEERDALRFLLASGNVLLVQAAPGMGEPDVYVTVGETAHPRISPYAREPWREWTLPLTEVDMPTGGLAGSATRTWQDVLIENATWGDVLNRYATWFDVLIGNRQT